MDRDCSAFGRHSSSSLKLQARNPGSTSKLGRQSRRLVRLEGTMLRKHCVSKPKSVRSTQSVAVWMSAFVWLSLGPVVRANAEPLYGVSRECDRLRIGPSPVDPFRQRHARRDRSPARCRIGQRFDFRHRLSACNRPAVRSDRCADRWRTKPHLHNRCCYWRSDPGVDFLRTQRFRDRGRLQSGG